MVFIVIPLLTGAACIFLGWVWAMFSARKYTRWPLYLSAAGFAVLAVSIVIGVNGRWIYDLGYVPVLNIFTGVGVLGVGAGGLAGFVRVLTQEGVPLSARAPFFLSVAGMGLLMGAMALARIAWPGSH